MHCTFSKPSNMEHTKELEGTRIGKDLHISFNMIQVFINSVGDQKDAHRRIFIHSS
jgi:hypothetical protein